MTESVWHAQTVLPRFPRLERDRTADVLVIGGGIAGLLSAYRLQQAGARVLLVEGGRICGGVTGNTTAKITAQHGLLYDKLLRRFGAEQAGLYLRANLKALKAYQTLCQRIDCDFELRDSCVYTLDRPEKIHAELEASKPLVALRSSASADLSEYRFQSPRSAGSRAFLCPRGSGRSDFCAHWLDKPGPMWHIMHD